MLPGNHPSFSTWATLLVVHQLAIHLLPVFGSRKCPSVDGDGLTATVAAAGLSEAGAGVGLTFTAEVTSGFNLALVFGGSSDFGFVFGGPSDFGLVGGPSDLGLVFGGSFRLGFCL